MAALVFILAVLLVGYAVSRSLDKETRQRLGFITKFAIGIIALTALWALR